MKFARFLRCFLGSCAVVALLVSCGPSRPEDFRRQGQRLQKTLTRQLHKIETRDDLVLAVPRLTELFDEFVDIMIAARQKGYEGRWEASSDLEPDEEQLSRRLRQELERVCGLEGGQDLITQCQKKALLRLDAHEQQLASKRW